MILLTCAVKIFSIYPNLFRLPAWGQISHEIRRLCLPHISLMFLSLAQALYVSLRQSLYDLLKHKVSVSSINSCISQRFLQCDTLISSQKQSTFIIQIQWFGSLPKFRHVCLMTQEERLIT